MPSCKDHFFTSRRDVEKTEKSDRIAIWYNISNTLNSCLKVSGVDTFQIRSVSETRLIRKLGQLSESEMQLISQALAVVLGLTQSK